MMIWENLINSTLDRFKNLGKLSAYQKQQLAVICAVVFSLILAFAVFVSIKSKTVKEEQPEGQERLPVNIPIPAEELFIPEEPEFLPGVLLDRERREVWTEEDAKEFWQDPLRAGEEQWRNKLDAAVEEILERIP